MKLKSQDIKVRFTGFALGPVGISWDFPDSERKIISDLFTELEDRRVLYNPYELESIKGTVHSVEAIRGFLNDTIKRLGLKATEQSICSVKDMRRACRKYLDETQSIQAKDEYLFFHNLGFGDQTKIATALGDLRTIVGVHLATLAIIYAIDVEAELVSIMPLEK